MKRTPMPPRRTPITRTTRLGAGPRSPVTRAVLPRKTPPVPDGAPRRERRESFPRPALWLVDLRDSTGDGVVPVRCCQRCGTARGLHRHHRRLKSSGGSRRPHTNCPCNAVTLCDACHTWAHVDDRPAAEDQGFIVGQAVDQPAAVSVLRYPLTSDGGRWWPSCTGSWCPAPPAQRASEKPGDKNSGGREAA